MSMKITIMVQKKTGQLQQKQNKMQQQEDGHQHDKRLPPKPRVRMFGNSEEMPLNGINKEVVSLMPNFEKYMDDEMAARQKKVDKIKQEIQQKKTTLSRSLRNYKR